MNITDLLVSQGNVAVVVVWIGNAMASLFIAGAILWGGHRPPDTRRLYFDLLTAIAVASIGVAITAILDIFVDEGVLPAPRVGDMRWLCVGFAGWAFVLRQLSWWRGHHPLQQP